MKKYMKLLNLLLVSILVLSACSLTDKVKASESATSQAISSDLSGEEFSQGNGDDPDYQTVFPQDQVNEITITISAENWDLMMEDMTALYGEQGSGQRAGPMGRPGGAPLVGQDQNRDQMPPAGLDQNRDQMAPPAGRMPGAQGGGVVGSLNDENPVWVEAVISFGEESWEHVGIRFKGNSSLRSTWGLGSLKLPFKLDFDQFEDDYPETEDQRFYGFKQISFGSNFHDDSLLREKVAADLFREAGVPSAQTAFYAVSIDYGEGPVYLGLYTAVEVVDDTLIETQFSDDDGNVYKPEGAAATFAAESFSEASFDKETNQDEDDYSDILALYDALHDQSRVLDPEEWRQDLEEVFDVEIFLNWLAVNTLIENWDTYGVMSHNYYLYHDPESEQLVWIPWDNNESLKSGGQMRDRGALSLDLGGVGDNWPLISYLRDDPVYYEKYLGYLESFLEEDFILENLAAEFEYYHNLIEPYVLDEGKGTTLISSAEAFDTSVDELIEHCLTRIRDAKNFLSYLN